MTQKKKSSKTVQIIVASLSAIFSFFVVQYFMKSEPNFEKVLIEVSQKINKTCPLKLDDETQLDNTDCLSKNTIVYNFTLFNTDKKEIENVNLMAKEIEPTIIKNIKTNPKLKIFRDNKTTIIYSYKDRLGKFMFKVFVSPDLYQ